jgi:hypothetical protein
VETKQLAVNLTLPADLRLKDNAKKLLVLRFEHPDWSYERLSQEVGLSKARISTILNHPRVLAALPHIARQRIKQLVPKATKAMEQLVEQNDNLMVKEKVVSRVLANEKVLDAPEIIVKNEITLKTVTELQQMVQSAGLMPTNVVETSLYTEENDANNQHKE